MTSRPRVFLADDHAMLLEAFTKLLEPSCDIVGTASDGMEVLELAPDLNPDVVVLDITMPRLNGIDAAKRLKGILPDVKIIFLTMNEDADLAARALADGASGFLVKNSAASELLQAIESALRGQTFITPLLANEVLTSTRGPRRAELTGRQQEVLKLITEGLSMKEIAAKLDITPRTVAHHKYTMMEALEIETTAELIRYAIRNGIAST